MPKKVTPAGDEKMMSPLPPDEQQQLDLFEEFCLESSNLSRSLPLWDTLPIFGLGIANEIPPNTPVQHIRPRESEYTYGNGTTVNVRVKPAMLRDSKTGSMTRMSFPGEREQLVAGVIRALGVQGHARFGVRMRSTGREKAVGLPSVTVAVTIRQIQRELQRTGHTYSWGEIEEALEILKGTHVTVTLAENGTKMPEISSNYYPEVYRDPEKGCYMVVLSLEESTRILKGDYRAIAYGRWVELRNSLARWLYQWLTNEHRGATKADPLRPEHYPFRFKLSDFIRLGLLPEHANDRSKKARNIDRARRAFEELQLKNIILRFKETPQRRSSGGRPMVIDVEWSIQLTDEEVEIIIESNKEARSRAHYQGPSGRQLRLGLAREPRDRLKSLARGPENR